MSVAVEPQFQMPLGARRGLPHHDLGPRDRDPTLALVAGLHGNELNGVFVLSRLAAFLAAVANGEHPGQRLRERVIVVPAVNVTGLNARSRNCPLNNEDLNRQFPGDASGDPGGRVAHAVLKLTQRAYYRIDIHGSNRDIEELPQVRLYEPNDDERASACLFGLPAVVERPISPFYKTTLAHAWRQRGGENFVLQAGRAGYLQTFHCDVLFHALIAFLDQTGVLEGVQLPADETDLHYFGLNQTFSLISEHAGFFVSHRRVGPWLQAGDLVGEVYDGFTGELRAEVRSPMSGLLSALRCQPLLCEGDLVARLQTLRQVGADVDSCLHGQEQ